MKTTSHADIHKYSQSIFHKYSWKNGPRISPVHYLECNHISWDHSVDHTQLAHQTLNIHTRLNVKLRASNHCLLAIDIAAIHMTGRMEKIWKKNLHLWITALVWICPLFIFIQCLVWWLCWQKWSGVWFGSSQLKGSYLLTLKGRLLMQIVTHLRIPTTKFFFIKPVWREIAIHPWYTLHYRKVRLYSILLCLL